MGLIETLTSSQYIYIVDILDAAVHLLATDCTVTTTLPYKIVYLDSKTVTAAMHGCDSDLRSSCPPSMYWDGQ